jgi:hypothetical protein
MRGVPASWAGKDGQTITASCFSVLVVKDTGVFGTLSFPVWVRHGDPLDFQWGLSALGGAATAF